MLVFSMIFCLCACGHKDEAPPERECGVYVTVEADDIFAVSCGTDSGSDSATHADGTHIDAGETFHFDIGGEQAEQSAKAIIPYMICIYDKDFNIIEDESFEDNFANMARIDIVVTKDHHIIYKGGEVNCGGKVVVSMSSYEDSLGVHATDAFVTVSGDEAVSAKINEALKGFIETFTEPVETNRANYEENVSGKSGEIPSFMMSHTISVARGDASILCFKMRDYTYLGTAEIETIIAHSYDVATGSELMLENVFNDVEALKNLCTEQILISTTDSGTLFNEGFTSVIPKLVDNGNWYFDSEGLVIIANKGDIADTAYEFSIPYADIEKYMNEEYLPETSDDITPGSINAVFADDADMDGLVFVGNEGEFSDGNIVITASGSIMNVGVYNVVYDEEANSFGLTDQIFFCSDLLEGGSFAINAELEEVPSLLVQFTTPYGTVVNNLLSVDAEGAIVITDPDGGDKGIDIFAELPFTIDINGDGTDEEISISGGTVSITSGVDGAKFDADFSEISVALLHDIDCDGAFELFIGGDIASDDYIVYCLKYDGDISVIPFDGEDYVCGDVKSFAANAVSICSPVDILGSYSYDIEYTCTDGKLSSEPGDSYKVNSEEYIAADVDLTLSDGTVVAAGTEMRVIETDLNSFVTVETKDGTTGNLEIAENSGEGGWLINGSPEMGIFSSLPYAG